MASGDNPQPGSATGEGLRKASNGKANEVVSRQQSVTELELAFAQNPESMAYVDLCLAYIEQARFMEAMVVCKKGIKAHPDSAKARILLARVYAAQKKYKRALQELDELAAAKPNEAGVYVARGKLKAESGDEPGAIEDLKKAIDLDKNVEEASALLKAQGIVYPEPPPPPPLPPPPVVGVDAPRDGSPLSAGSTSIPGMVSGFASVSAPGLPPGVVAVVPLAAPLSISGPEGRPIEGAPAQAALVDASGRAVSVVPGPAGAQYVVLQPAYPVPQRLEGEDELEAMAREVADVRQERGRPRTSLLLLIGLVLLGGGLVYYRFHEKARIEAIDRLTSDGINAFNQDTYGSYKTAAGYFEQILDRQDANHPLTLGRLAHTYVILWGEHGEKDVKPKLEEILARAERRAPEVSHTVAARALLILYDGKDRQANAALARERLQPFIERVKAVDGAPSYADLALGIIDLELGDYENATTLLGNVKQVLPGSVRAKVWHARAAFRAGRYGTAEAAFLEALRAKPGHPGARAGLALVKVVRGDLNGAAENIVKFDELPQKEISDRDRALAEFARSEVFRAAGEEAKATGAYENAIRFDPGNADFPYGLGKFLLDQDRPKEAIPHLKKAVEMEKTRASFLVTLSEAEMQLGDFKAAEGHIGQALKRSSKSLEADLARARLLRRTRSPETEPYLKKLLVTWPTAEADIELELGRYDRALQKYDEAKVELEKAVDKMGGQPPSKQGEIVLSYGKLLEDRHETEAAVKSYRQAGELGNIEAWFWLSAALAHGNKDERAEAKRACERYLAAGTSLRYSEDARKICEQLH